MSKSDSNQITRDYFDSILLETRYMDADLPSTEYKLWGESFKTPIMTAALSHLGTVCDDGMVEYGKGARDANAVHWVGMGDIDEFTQIAKTGAKSIKIVKPYAEEEEIFSRLSSAINDGAFAVGMDIDHCFGHSGDYDNVLGMKMHSKTTAQIKEYVEYSKLPFIIKGVLSVQDAMRCLDAGVKGIVVSHHHGIMNYAVPPLMVLPDIVKAVGGQMEIFVDCGIESGMDAFKALALGANAVSVGRALMGPLKDGGKAVTEKINAMTAELKSIMARTGAKSLDDIDPSVVHFLR